MPKFRRRKGGGRGEGKGILKIENKKQNRKIAIKLGANLLLRPWQNW